MDDFYIIHIALVIHQCISLLISPLLFVTYVTPIVTYVTPIVTYETPKTIIFTIYYLHYPIHC